MTLSTFLPRLDRRFTNWLGISFLIHFLIILGIGVQVQSPQLKQALSPTLEIMLVNGKSSSTPHHANALAQVNLEGGGNTDTHIIAKSPFPANHPISPKKIQKEEKKVRELEKELHTLLAISKMNENNEIRPANNPAPHNPSRHTGLSPNPQTLKIRSLEAQISREVVAYEQRPRRQFIGARTRQYRFARYIERWRTRIERIGNLNYPNNIKALGLHGSLQITVSIRANGSLDGIVINRSSGNPLLDKAAKQIIRMAVPFLPFPPDIRKDTDILSITRTYIFTQSNSIKSE